MRTISNEPICPVRTPAACDFTDRLRQLAHDVRVIELAVQAALNDNCNEGDCGAIAMACRKLESEIELLADIVLPAMSDKGKAVVAAALNGGRS